MKNNAVLERLFEDYTSGVFEAPNGLDVFRLRDDCHQTLATLRDADGHLLVLRRGYQT